MKKSSVLIINTWTKLGGGERVSLELASFFQNHGYDVAILSCFVNLSFFDERFKAITFLLPPKWIASLSQKNKFFLIFLGFSSLLFLTLIHARKYSALNPHNFPSLWVAGCASFLWGKPLIWQFNEPQPIPKLFYPIDRIFLKKVSSIIVLDKKNEEKVKELYNRKSQIIHPGVDVPFWSSSSEIKIADKKYNLSEKTILLSVGKLHAQKNQIILTDVVYQLQREIPNIFLVLTGEGPDRKKIEERAHNLGIQHKVLFVGIVEANVLRSLYHFAFLLCFPALDQAWGLTPFEALCQKSVSVVSDQAGAIEVLKPAKIAYIASPTISGFTRAILEAYNDPQEVRKRGERGNEYVKNHLTWNIFSKKVLSVVTSFQ